MAPITDGNIVDPKPDAFSGAALDLTMKDLWKFVEEANAKAGVMPPREVPPQNQSFASQSTSTHKTATQDTLTTSVSPSVGFWEP